MSFRLPALLYILDADGNPVAEPDMHLWGRWFEKVYNTDERQVADWRGLDMAGVEIRVSTVFLGTDMNFGTTGPPILWETMVFGGEHDGDQLRAASKKEALRNHRAMLKQVNAQVSGLMVGE